MIKRWRQSPLLAAAAMVPKDRGGRLVQQGAVYGPHPRHRIDVYAPRSAAERSPLLLFFYGGSWSSGLREAYGFVGRALAARGYVVGIPDYRLVPEIRYPAFVEDCAAATAWLSAEAARFGGDADRIGLLGHSAGAYNAAMLSLDPAWLGPLRRRIRAFVGMAGPYDFLPLRSAATRAAFDGAPGLEASQPVRHAGPGAPPSLLLHGEADRTVAPRNSRLLAERIAGGGGESRLILYPGLTHVGLLGALALPFRGRAPVLSDIFAFADAKMRG